VLWNRNYFCGSCLGPTLEKFWFQFWLRFRLRFWFRIQTIFSTFFQQHKFVQNPAFSMSGEAIFPENWPLILYFLFHFMLDPDPNPFPEPECFTVPVPLRQKATFPAVPVPQHCIHSIIACFLKKIIFCLIHAVAKFMFALRFILSFFPSF
jgi:hypothetical protein